MLKEKKENSGVCVGHVLEAVRRMQRDGRIEIAREGYFMFDTCNDIFRESNADSLVVDITNVPEIMTVLDDDEDDNY